MLAGGGLAVEVEVGVGLVVEVEAEGVQVGAGLVWLPGIRAASGEAGERSDRWKT